MGAEAMSLPILIARYAVYMQSVSMRWALTQCRVNWIAKMIRSVTLMVVREVKRVGKSSSSKDATVGQTGMCSTVSASGTLHKGHG